MTAAGGPALTRGAAQAAVADLGGRSRCHSTSESPGCEAYLGLI
jgi:hypothetical protein